MFGTPWSKGSVFLAPSGYEKDTMHEDADWISRGEKGINEFRGSDQPGRSNVMPLVYPHI